MMYICNDCGSVFSEDELAKWEEDRGEFWGMPCTETVYGCPVCHSEAVEEWDSDYGEEEEEGDDDDGRTD